MSGVERLVRDYREVPTHVPRVSTVGRVRDAAVSERRRYSQSRHLRRRGGRKHLSVGENE